MRIRNLGAGALIALTLATAVACAGYGSRDEPDEVRASVAADKRYQERANAILSYVEAEREQIPKIQTLIPGVYSEVRAEASMEEQSGDRGIPAGTYAVAHFHYTYSNNTDWSSTIAGLDASRGAIDQLCEDTLFPAMLAAGVTLPMGVTFNYSDPRSEFGPVWSHACSKWE